MRAYDELWVFIDSGNSSPPICVSNKLDVIDCLQVLDGHFTAPPLTSLPLLTGDLSTVKSHITDRISMRRVETWKGKRRFFISFFLHSIIASFPLSRFIYRYHSFFITLIYPKIASSTFQAKHKHHGKFVDRTEIFFKENNPKPKLKNKTGSGSEIRKLYFLELF